MLFHVLYEKWELNTREELIQLKRLRVNITERDRLQKVVQGTFH
jgi:hypothetical protein